MKAYTTEPICSRLSHYNTSAGFAEEFRSPAGNTRPRIRWWLPSAYLSMGGIENDIRSMAEAGFGGAEVVPMPRFDIPGDLTIEWGTPRWKAFAEHILETAGKYNFTIDFSMTPFWPLALPSVTDASNPEHGAQMETDCAWIDGITKAAPFSGSVPVSEQAVADAASVGCIPRLAAVTCAKYADKPSHTLVHSSARAFLLNREVLADKSDPLSWSLSFTPEEDGEYVIFAWWEHPSGNKTCQNLQLDHYSRKATKLLTDYWEKELIPCFGDNFRHTVSMFIDSLEFQTHLDWTRSFLDSFLADNGYDLAPYLPALYDEDSPGCFVSFPEPDFRFDEYNKQILNDYHEFVTRLYIENHLKPLTEFCERHEINMRYQTSYGKSLELAQTAMYVTIPETETLYGGDILDFYRLQSGSMHLSGKQIYSIEASAEMNGRGNGGINSGNYQQTWGNQLWHMGRAFSCGVNQAVFHGYSYEGFYEGEGNENGFLPGTHWPGYTTMGYSEFSNNWSSCQPNWLHARLYTDFLARNQLVLRQGSSKMDLAVYRHSYEEIIDFNHAVKLYDDDGLLEQLGYTYDFVSPSSLELSGLCVSDGRLAPDGPAYQALLLNAQQFLPYSTALKLLEFTKAGLPVLFIGTLPGQSAFHLEKDIYPIIEEMLRLPLVKQVDSVRNVPSVLLELGILPNARYHSPSKMLNVHRQTQQADFYYFYNYGDADTYPLAREMAAVKTDVTLHGSGVPFLLNAWDGRITPIAAYESTDTTVTLRLRLDKNDSCIIALIREPGYLDTAFPGLHTVLPELWAEYTDGQQILLKSLTGAQIDVPFSDKKVVSAGFTAIPASIPLKGWELTLEKWSESPVPNESIKSIQTFFSLEHLVPWKELPGQEFTSGIGTYRISFSLDNGWEDGIGYLLNLGDVCDSFSIVVNQQEITVNQSSSLIDIGSYLHSGVNTLCITVASTLLNALLAYSNCHPLSFSRWQKEIRVPDAYGILNDVTLVPYAWSIPEN